MFVISRRCVGAILALLLLCPAWGQKPTMSARPTSSAPPVWHTEQIALPATPLAAPLPWVKAPSGPGEFLLGLGKFFARFVPISTEAHQLIGTTGGVLSLEKDGSLRLVSAAFGRPTMVVGRFDGCLWVQQVGGDLIGLDPDTLAEKARVAGLAGPCFAIDGASIWCYDSIEMAKERMYVRGGWINYPFASAIIEYSRAGKELRRFTADGVSLPKMEIFRAIVDTQEVWVIVRPCLSVYENGEKHYGDSQLLRLDRVSGHYQSIEHSNGINTRAIDLPDRLIWGVYDEYGNDKPGELSTISVLDKHTGKVTQTASIPPRYARGLYAVRDDQLWCLDYAEQEHNLMNFTGEPEMTIAVFSLNGGKRLRRDETGPPPPGLPALIEPARYRTLAGYSVIGGTTGSAWMTNQQQQLHEIPDTGPTLLRDCTALGGVSRLAMGYSGLAHDFVGIVGDLLQHDHAIIKILPGAQTAVRCDIGASTYPFAASERRIWFTNSENVISCDADLQPKALTVSPRVSDGLYGYPSLPFGDDLYAYGGAEIVRVDGKAGKAIPINSWSTQVPAIWQRVFHPEAVFRALDGSIVFNLSLRDEQGEAHATALKMHTVLAAYNPDTDKWTVTPCNRMQWWGDTLHTPHGALYVPRSDNTLYRGAATDWVAVGKFPCCMDELRYGAATAQYLYVDSPLGVYRVRWSELLGPEAR